MIVAKSYMQDFMLYMTLSAHLRTNLKTIYIYIRVLILIVLPRYPTRGESTQTLVLGNLLELWVVAAEDIGGCLVGPLLVVL